MDKQTILVHGVLTFSESISLTLELDKRECWYYHYVHYNMSKSGVLLYQYM